MIHLLHNIMEWQELLAVDSVCHSPPGSVLHVIIDFVIYLTTIITAEPQVCFCFATQFEAPEAFCLCSVTYGVHVRLRKEIRLPLTGSYAAFRGEKWEKVQRWTWRMDSYTPNVKRRNIYHQQLHNKIRFIFHADKLISQQECFPVGCVLPAAVALRRGVCLSACWDTPPPPECGPGNLQGMLGYPPWTDRHV